MEQYVPLQTPLLYYDYYYERETTTKRRLRDETRRTLSFFLSTYSVLFCSVLFSLVVWWLSVRFSASISSLLLLLDDDDDGDKNATNLLVDG